MVPTTAEPPTIPFTDQVTAGFEVPVTTADSARVPPVTTFAEVGVTCTATAAVTTLTFTTFPVTPPGPGSATATRNVPGAAAVPLPVRRVDDT